MTSVVGEYAVVLCRLSGAVQVFRGFTTARFHRPVRLYKYVSNILKELLVLQKCKTLKYLQNICTTVSVTYLQHIGIWPHNISVTTDDRTGTGGQVCHFLLHFLDASSYSIYVWSLLDSNLPYVHILVCP